MVFINVPKRMNHQSAKLMKQSTTSKLYSLGKFYMIKRFMIDFKQLMRKGSYFKADSPLMSITIGSVNIPVLRNSRALESKNKPNFISFGAFLNLVSHSNVIINNNRQLVNKIINGQSFSLRPNANIIYIVLYKPIAFASNQDIQQQLKQLLNCYINRRTTTPASTTPSAIQQSVNFFNLSRPFNLSIWKSRQSTFSLFKTQLQSNIQIDIYLCHYYKLFNSRNKQQIRQDMQNLGKMLQKVDLFKLISRMQPNSATLRLARCKKLVHILKWKSSQTQKYLIFLLNQFGQINISTSISLFHKVYSNIEATQSGGNKTAVQG